MFETGFICTPSQNVATVCKFLQQLKFEPVSILKNKNNSALLTFGTSRSLTFPILRNHLDTDQQGFPRRYNLTFTVNGSAIGVETHLMAVNNNEVMLLVNFDMTIECAESELVMDLSKSMYTPALVATQFRACGDNEPLEVSQNL